MINPTKQQLLDKTYHHFITMKNPPGMQGKQCVIRSGHPRPKRCAIGIHIPKKVFKPEMNDGALLELMKNFPEVHPYLGGLDNTDFLLKLQDAHDEAAFSRKPFRDEFATRLRAVCNEYKLDFPGDLL